MHLQLSLGQRYSLIKNALLMKAEDCQAYHRSKGLTSISFSVKLSSLKGDYTELLTIIVWNDWHYSKQTCII